MTGLERLGTLIVLVAIAMAIVNVTCDFDRAERQKRCERYRATTAYAECIG